MRRVATIAVVGVVLAVAACGTGGLSITEGRSTRKATVQLARRSPQNVLVRVATAKVDCLEQPYIVFRSGRDQTSQRLEEIYFHPNTAVAIGTGAGWLVARVPTDAVRARWDVGGGGDEAQVRHRFVLLFKPTMTPAQSSSGTLTITRGDGTATSVPAVATPMDGNATLNC